MEPEEIATLVEQARAGESLAWDRIVDAYTPLVWSVVRRVGLGDASSADAVQLTWLSLLEHLDQVNEPARLAGWLRTTARRSCLQLIRRASREQLVDYQEFEGFGRRGDAYRTEVPGPESDVVRREQVALLRVAITSLPTAHRTLLELLNATPSLSYEQISEQTGMPVGSIGPTRGRIFARLRRELEAVGLRDAVPA